MPDTVTHFVLDRLTTTEYKQRRKTEFSPVTIKISDGVTNLCKYTYWQNIKGEVWQWKVSLQCFFQRFVKPA